jgi:hypothetical protein
MRILLFLHGTILMHHSGRNKSPHERVLQVTHREPEIYDFDNYIPIGEADRKVNLWHKAGAKISYLSSHKDFHNVQKDICILEKFGFPKGNIFFRRECQKYHEIAAIVRPEVLIEDKCNSIGGTCEMVVQGMDPEIRKKMTAITIEEFNGIDHLPDDPNELRYYFE